MGLFFFFFNFELQAPPPSRSSPERDSEIDFVAVDPKSMVTNGETVSGTAFYCLLHITYLFGMIGCEKLMMLVLYFLVSHGRKRSLRWSKKTRKH